MKKHKVEIIEGLTVDLTSEQLAEVSRKLQSVADKVQEEEVKPKATVGGYVRATINGTNISKGRAYKVVDIVGDTVIIKDNIKNEHMLSTYNYEVIENPTPFDRAGRKLDEYKNGDIVCITKYSGGHSAGQLGTVLEVGKSGCVLVRAIKSGELNDMYETELQLVAPVENCLDIV